MGKWFGLRRWDKPDKIYDRKRDYTVGTDDAVCYEYMRDIIGEKWYFAVEDSKVICPDCYKDRGEQE